MKPRYRTFPCTKPNRAGKNGGYPVQLLDSWTGPLVHKGEHTGTGWMRTSKFYGSHVTYRAQNGNVTTTRRSRILMDREEYLTWIDQRQLELYKTLIRRP